MSEACLVEQLKDKTAAFVELITRSIKQLRATWRARETLDVRELMIDVLALRNFDVFESFLLVIDQHSPPAADMLLRPLFEGTVILEWCALDPVPRALRFRRTSFESTLELVDLNWMKLSPDHVASLRDSVEWFDREGHQDLPNMRQMVDKIAAFKPGAGYIAYKQLSKLVHGLLEVWPDYASAEHASAREIDWNRQPRRYNSLAVSGYLAMRNIILLPVFDPYLTSPLLCEIQAAWSQLYSAFDEGDAVRALTS